MKCPHCGAWTDVSATRPNVTETMIKRRRKCANGHAFTTYEVLPGAVDRRATKRSASATPHRSRIWARDQKILADTRTAKELSAIHGITEARVRQIRAAAR